MIAVAAGHDLTAEAAATVLEAGGTAIDGALAAAFMAFICEPVLAGPLGGGFLLHVPRDGRARLLDAFVHTPLRARTDADLRAVEADFGESRQIFHVGAASVAASGLVPALFEAHSSGGRVPMREIMAPAVEAARKGVGQTAFQARLSRIVAPVLTHTQESRALFTRDGTLLGEGDSFRNPALADVLETTAIEGARLFMDGEVGQALAALDGGHLTRDDLRRYMPRYRDPLNIPRNGNEVLLNPAPSIGGAQIALGLSGLPHKPTAVEMAAVLAAVHDLRHAHGIGADADHIARLRRLLARRGIRQTGTTHISVLDRNGDGVALTLSNGTGAGIILPGTGIMPNNMLGEDDLLPDGIGGWAPDTRLASAMCPTALRRPDGSVTLLGSGGSSRIRSAILQVAVRLLDDGARLEDAITAPRLHVDGQPCTLDVEGNCSEGELAALRDAWPHLREWSEPSLYFGGVHAVHRDRNARHVEAAADPRRAGVAIVRR